MKLFNKNFNEAKRMCNKADFIVRSLVSFTLCMILVIYAVSPVWLFVSIGLAVVAIIVNLVDKPYQSIVILTHYLLILIATSIAFLGIIVNG